MSPMIVHVTKDMLLERLILSRFSFSERMLVLRAVEMAEICLKNVKPRRDGTPAVEHSYAIALKGDELEVDAETMAVLLLHDVLEDNLKVTPWDVYWHLGPTHGISVREGVIAHTQTKEMSDLEYFANIERSAQKKPMFAFVKPLDVWHFHSDNYNGPIESELRKIARTNGIFLETACRCREFLHDPVLYQKHEDLTNRILKLARARKNQITTAA